MPEVNFYWVGDGQYQYKKLQNSWKNLSNFKWLGRLEYPRSDVRIFLETIDVYALITGMDLSSTYIKRSTA